jgi:hypothetical protein
MKSAFTKYLFYLLNIILLLYLVFKLHTLEAKIDKVLDESDLNNSKMDYLDSDINKRNAK